MLKTMRDGPPVWQVAESSFQLLSKDRHEAWWPWGGSEKGVNMTQQLGARVRLSTPHFPTKIVMSFILSS